MLLGVVGTIVEATQIGDVKNVNYEALDAQPFTGVINHNNITLAKKESWTYPIISFSYVRNMLMYS